MLSNQFARYKSAFPWLLILAIFICTVKAYFRIESGESGGLLTPVFMISLVFTGIPRRKVGLNDTRIHLSFMFGVAPVFMLKLLHQDQAASVFLDLLFIAGCANLLYVTYLTFATVKHKLPASEPTPEK